MIIAFSDLDDTLFSSPREFTSHGGAKIASILPNGKVGAYSSHAQRKMFELLSENCVLIPVTGRRTDSLNRVLHQFKHDKIASHGAIILNSENIIHPEWRPILDAEGNLWNQKMVELSSIICEHIEKNNLNVRVRIVEDYGYPCYLCVKGSVGDLIRISNLSNLSNFSDDFCIHLNGRNLAYLPPYASKKRAVSFLKNYYENEFEGHSMYLGLGDSISDLPFMSECHFQILPSSSQIAEKFT